MLQAPQGSMRRPGSEFARETGAEPVTEKAPEQSVKLTRTETCLSSSYGAPVLEWWRPGGSDLAIIGQGLQAYLSLPPRCVGVSYHKASQQGSSQSQAFREDERDGSGNDASRGKSHHSLASERSSGDGWYRRT